MSDRLRCLLELPRALVDLVMPPACAGCGALLAGGLLCESCAALVEPRRGAACPVCGLAFEGAGDDHPCGLCLRDPPAFLSTSVAFAYDGPVAEGLRALKYGPRPERLGALGALWRDAAGVLPEVDLAVPVPLHRQRLIERGFNQTALLAKPLLRGRRIPLDVGSLERPEPAPAQASLTLGERLKAPAGAFRVPPRRARKLAGKRVLLLDDVMTTGATLRACARTLMTAGAAEVHVAVLTRA